MRNPGQSVGCTRQSEVESVDIVHTSFLFGRPPRNGDLMRPCALKYCTGKPALPPLQIEC